jgi:hypothetical protein
MNNQFLYIVFRFQNNIENDLQETGTYRIVYLFDKDGQISLEEESLANSFSDKESLVAKLLDYMGDGHYSDAYLISVNDLNIGLETCHQKSDFTQLFMSHGNHLKVDTGLNKKSFLDRFF